MSEEKSGYEGLARDILAAVIAHRSGISHGWAMKTYVKPLERIHPTWVDVAKALAAIQPADLADGEEKG